jgi:predicted RNase H-like HicB family nuclease
MELMDVRDLAIILVAIISREVAMTFTAYVEWDPETKLYVGIVPTITGAHTQAATLDELQKNLKEVLELCLEENKDNKNDLPQFVGLQQIEISL